MDKTIKDKNTGEDKSSGRRSTTAPTRSARSRLGRKNEQPLMAGRRAVLDGQMASAGVLTCTSCQHAEEIPDDGAACRSVPPLRRWLSPATRVDHLHRCPS
ncbi:hypothetical protein [Pseudonocardia sp. Ae717_Ps2]|uniref:hypothetical protein n=1 Tax=Pseudonocardia sp. Ae717_Ps2 TaxID=1885573 RepID=UPI001185AE67|nr:hypothetical protein [Pseudonocardia sp. Ae717_Ps2]